MHFAKIQNHKKRYSRTPSIVTHITAHQGIITSTPHTIPSLCQHTPQTKLRGSRRKTPDRLSKLDYPAIKVLPRNQEEGANIVQHTGRFFGKPGNISFQRHPLSLGTGILTPKTDRNGAKGKLPVSAIYDENRYQTGTVHCCCRHPKTNRQT